MSRSRQKGERFAKLPIELLKHPAVTTLEHAAFRVLAIFAAGYTGTNNGTLCATDVWVRQFGMNSRDTLYSSIKMLRKRGLIEVTRPGIKHRKVPTLYAITWQPVHFRNGELLGRLTPPSHAYRDWKPAEIQSAGRTSLSPVVGLETGDFSPISPTKEQGFQSAGREYSKTLGRIPGSVSARSAPLPALLSIPDRNPQNGGAPKIERLARLQSHLTDGDIAKITGEPIELVQRVREAMR